LSKEHTTVYCPIYGPYPNHATIAIIVLLKNGNKTIATDCSYKHIVTLNTRGLERMHKS